MPIRKMVLVFLLVLFIFTGCSKEYSQPPSIIPTPETGKATLAGRVLDQEGRPLDSVPLRLAEVYHDKNDSEKGAFVLDTAFSPGTVADKNGFFVFSNVTPGEYILVVGDVEVNNYVIVLEKDGRAKIWNIPADQITDIGVLKVPFTK